jgi:hypothetical protein
MENILIFNKETGKGIDVDILDNGRLVIDYITSKDFEVSNEF